LRRLGLKIRDNMAYNYTEYIKGKYSFGLFLLFLLLLVSLASLCLGSYPLTPSEVFNALMGCGTNNSNLVVWNMRLPRITASIIAGLSLAVAGAVMQCVLMF